MVVPSELWRPSTRHGQHLAPHGTQLLQASCGRASEPGAPRGVSLVSEATESNTVSGDAVCARHEREPRVQ